MKIHAPLLPCLLGLATGIWVQGFAVAPWWILPVAAAGMALVFWRLKASPLQRIRLSRLNAGRWGAALLFCTVSALDAWILLPGRVEIPADKTLTGTVVKASPTSYGQSLIVQVDGASGARAMLYCGLEPELRKADRIAWPNNLQEAADPSSLIPAQRKRFLASQGVAWIQTVSDGDMVLMRRSERRITDASKDYLSRKLEESSLPVATAAFLQSLLLGDRRLLAQEERQTFADSGVAHVLALSGLHIGMIAAVLTLLFLPLNALGAWKWKYPLVVALLWLYAALTGLSAPTVRACVMATFLSVAIMAERRNSAFNALCAAAIAILFADPAALGEPGFQLSFVCVASLILFGSYFQRGRGARRRMLSAVGACLIATFGSWAVSAWWFGSFPLSFLPANLILLPFLPFYIGAGGFYLLSLCLGSDPAWLANLLEWGHAGALEFCRLLSGMMPPLHFAVHWLVPVLWLGAIGCLAWYIHASRRKAWGILAATLSLCALGGLALPAAAESEADGIVIRDQPGRIILTHFSNGEEARIQMPPEIHSTLRHKGLTIMAADRAELPAAPADADVLILASGWKGSVTPLLERVKPRLLVIHPSVLSFMLDDIRSEAKRAGVPVHDLRTEGPLRLPEQGSAGLGGSH